MQRLAWVEESANVGMEVMYVLTSCCRLYIFLINGFQEHLYEIFTIPIYLLLLATRAYSMHIRKVGGESFALHLNLLCISRVVAVG